MNMLVNIDVPDLEAALAFYRQAFNLTPGRRFGNDGVELIGFAVPIYLLVKPAGSKAAPTLAEQRSYERHWTPVHLDLVVAEVGGAVDRAVAAGAVLETGPRSADWGTLATLSDPFGNGFCILSFSDRGYDALADPPERANPGAG